LNHETDHSVSGWFVRLREGDSEAAQLLWERYFNSLVRVARKRLGPAARRAADEEDVAISAFENLCQGAAAGRFPDVRGRDELWRLLVSITRQKVIDQIRWSARAKRGGGLAHTEDALLDQLQDAEPTPEFLALLNEQHEELFAALRDDTCRRIARMKLHGYKNEEISEELGISMRSVERKLMLIRDCWSARLAT
jgi:RNA polymerase sigma factor (sigma-70 family)